MNRRKDGGRERIKDEAWKELGRERGVFVGADPVYGVLPGI